MSDVEVPERLALSGEGFMWRGARPRLGSPPAAPATAEEEKEEEQEEDDDEPDAEAEAEEGEKTGAGD